MCEVQGKGEEEGGEGRGGKDMGVRLAELPAFPTCHALSAGMVDACQHGICLYVCILLSIFFVLLLVLLSRLFQTTHSAAL